MVLGSRGAVGPFWGALLAGAVLAGCAVAPPPPASPPSQQSPAPPQPDILLGPQGLLIAGTGLEIGFGRTEASTVAAVSKLLGAGPSQTAAVPGCGQVRAWPGGLALTFQGGDFRGWQARLGGFQSVTEGTQAGRVCASAAPEV